ncbi:zinc finger protein 185 isoform X2 [Eleginops maclovinus]|uniref:zinc finger protein 185 isoform X2 n=1 Tax=Eleginops maclovinus TaxID=56733 RepID=UPI00307FD7CD
MSKVDRNKVFQTTRVRTSLKNDEYWIQRSKQEKKEEDKASTDQAVESRLSSYVLSTAKKFEAIDSSQSTSLLTAPSEGNSANQANGEVIPPKDAQPEGSTVGPTDDAKLQAPTEEMNVEAQLEIPIANTIAENKKQHAAENKSTVEPSDGAAELHFAGSIQNGEAPAVSSTQENPEAVSHVETAEQPLADATAEIKGVQSDATIEQSKIELNEAIMAADAPLEDPAAETSAVAGTEESKGITEVPAAPVIKRKPQEEPSITTESTHMTHWEDGGVKSTAQTAEESCEKGLPEQAAVVVEADAINTTSGEETALQDNVEPVPDLVSESLSEMPAQPAAEMSTEGSCEKGPAEKEPKEVVAEAAVDSSPEAPAVTNAAREESETQVSVKSVPDLVAESISQVLAQPAAETSTDETCEKGSLEQAAVEMVETVTEVVEVSPSDTIDIVNTTPGEEAAVQDNVEAVAEAAVDSSPETPAVTIEAGTETPLQVSVEQVPVLVAESVAEVPAQLAAETATEGGCEKGSQEQAAVEVVAVVVEVVEKSLSDTSDMVNATQGEEAAVTLAAETEPPLQVSVEQVPDIVAETLSEFSTQAAVKSAPSEERVLETKAEQVAEVQPVYNTVVEQMVEPTPERATNPLMELNIEEALLEPVPASEHVQDKSSDSTIEQSKALDVEPPKTEAAPKPQKDPKPADQNQNPDNTRNTNVCSYCDKLIDGNVKFYLNEPVITCHPDCLKCGVCATDLGDLLTAIFLHGQMIHCGGCFQKTLII